MTNLTEEFEQECLDRVNAYPDTPLAQSAQKFMLESTGTKYSYNFSWLSRPIIQYPQDIIAMQEIIYRVKPDLIIETGIAHGGSLIFSASMLAMLDYMEAVDKGISLDPRTSKRKILGVDIDIRQHNFYAIKSHSMSHMIDMIEGSSISDEIIQKIHNIASGYKRVLVCLDSNHTHEHVLAELEAYAPLTSQGSYCCVFDTIVEDLPENMYPNRPWDVGNNPKTAVHEYLKSLQQDVVKASDGEALNFSIDTVLDNKLLISVAPDGYLKRI